MFDLSLQVRVLSNRVHQLFEERRGDRTNVALAEFYYDGERAWEEAGGSGTTRAPNVRM